MKKAAEFARWMVLMALMSSGSLFAQVVQYGRVVEMNSGGKELSGVSVTIPTLHDCQPTMSDKKGVFRLSFSEQVFYKIFCLSGLLSKPHHSAC